MPVLAQKWLGSLIRHGLTLLSGYLVAKGWVSEGDTASAIEALTPLLISAIWSCYQKYGSTLMQEALRALPSGASREEAARDIRLMSAAEKVQTAFGAKG